MKNNNLQDLILKYTHTLAVQIIEEKDRIIFDDICLDVEQNPDKYGIDELLVITREDIKELLRLGIEAKKKKSKKEK